MDLGYLGGGSGGGSKEFGSSTATAAISGGVTFGPRGGAASELTLILGAVLAVGLMVAVALFTRRS